LGERGRIDEDLWLIDATNIRASRAAAGGRGGKAARRAPRPRPRPIPRRLRHQAAPDHRRQRRPPGRQDHARPGPRVEAPGEPAGVGLAQAARSGPSSPSPPTAGRRQGVQLCSHPPLSQTPGD
jgi:hypothetical protein